MANLRSTSPLNAHYSADSSPAESLSDDVNTLNGSSSVASPVIPTPLTLSDLLRSAFDDYHGGSIRCRMVNLGGGSRYSMIGAHMNGEGDADEDDDIYVYINDLDDELVPRSHTKKLPRDGLRKPGKKAPAKVRNNKKSTYTEFKPGCIHGKHGFGINFRC